MRARLIFFGFLAAATISVTGSAQSIQERCAALRADTLVALREHQAQVAHVDRLAAAHDTAKARRDALEGTVSSPIFVILLSEKGFTRSDMLRFREKHALPTALADAPDAPGFWSRATAQLLHEVGRAVTLKEQLLERLNATRNAYKNLRCAEPTDPLGQLPVERRSDGQPIITDALITRWVKASYALKNTGGAYWQAGRMTQQDYREVDGRIQLYFTIMNSGRAADQFSDAEMRAMNIRLPDIRNVREGNWSLINP